MSISDSGAKLNMGNYLIKFMSSYKSTLLLLGGYALLLALATWIEKLYGTSFAKLAVYHSPLLFLWHGLLVLNFIFIAIKYKLMIREKLPVLIIHFAFIIILLGALCTFTFGKEGILHLREGETSNIAIQTSQGHQTMHQLPFSIELKKFTLTRYPGSHSPSSFESDLIVHVDGNKIPYKVFMNNVLDMQGYRFFQSSYDEDEKGTILSMNQDLLGRVISYSGYFFLFLGLLLSFINKNSRFRILSRKLTKLQNKAVLLLLFACFPGLVYATDSKQQDINNFKVNAEHLNLFASLPVQSANGRIMPMSTFASEFLRKVHKNNTYKGLSPEQVLISILANPNLWIHEPLIDGGKSYVQMFDSKGDYLYQSDVERVYQTDPSERNSFDKDIIKLDERVQIIHEILQYRMLRCFPASSDASYRWYAAGENLSGLPDGESVLIRHLFSDYINAIHESIHTQDWTKANNALDKIRRYQVEHDRGNIIDKDKISSEVLYNQLNIFQHCKRAYLIIGGILLILVLISILTGRQSNFLKKTKLIAGIFVLLFFLFHTYGLGLRWYISGHVPWSDSYETMLYVAWISILGGLIFARRSFPIFALATIFSGVVLFVSGLNWLDPQINPLVPVLQSPWLMFHVAVIVAAYGFFGIGAMASITNLLLIGFMPKNDTNHLSVKIKELTIINEMTLLLGLALMTVGTFLGAIWANESWGRYWSWDPKETWALITMIIYALVLHIRLIGKKESSIWLFNVCSQFAILSVLMTYFGVNYFLSGMHSYGNSDAISGVTLYGFIISAILFVLPTIISYKKRYYIN